MEINRAEVIHDGGEVFLSLSLLASAENIPITQDEPRAVQSVFNNLIKALRKGAFNFKIDEVEGGDIYYHVAKEYIEQLNTELVDVYEEMVERNFLVKPGSETGETGETGGQMKVL